MTTLNLEYAQDHLAELVEKAGNGESFVITKGGTPIAQLTAIKVKERLIDEPINAKRTGFMQGQSEREIGFFDGMFRIPDDIKAIDQDEILADFEGRP